MFVSQCCSRTSGGGEKRRVERGVRSGKQFSRSFRFPFRNHQSVRCKRVTRYIAGEAHFGLAPRKCRLHGRRFPQTHHFVWGRAFLCAPGACERKQEQHVTVPNLLQTVPGFDHRRSSSVSRRAPVDSAISNLQTNAQCLEETPGVDCTRVTRMQEVRHDIGPPTVLRSNVRFVLVFAGSSDRGCTSADYCANV